MSLRWQGARGISARKKELWRRRRFRGDVNIRFDIN